MLYYGKQLWSRDTFLLSLTLVAQIVVLTLSLTKIDPGFWPRTTPARLYANIGTNAALIVVLVFCRLALKCHSDKDRRAVALVVSSMLLGIGGTILWWFDTGLGNTYITCAGFLFWSTNRRVNA